MVCWRLCGNLRLCNRPLCADLGLIRNWFAPHFCACPAGVARRVREASEVPPNAPTSSKNHLRALAQAIGIISGRYTNANWDASEGMFTGDLGGATEVPPETMRKAEEILYRWITNKGGWYGECKDCAYEHLDARCAPCSRCSAATHSGFIPKEVHG
jgi:hypothetical protein